MKQICVKSDLTINSCVLDSVVCKSLVFRQNGMLSSWTSKDRLLCTRKNWITFLNLVLKKMWSARMRTPSVFPEIISLHWNCSFVRWSNIFLPVLLNYKRPLLFSQICLNTWTRCYSSNWLFATSDTNFLPWWSNSWRSARLKLKQNVSLTERGCRGCGTDCRSLRRRGVSSMSTWSHPGKETWMRYDYFQLGFC